MNKCIVTNCEGRHDRYHCLPKAEDAREKWLIAINRKDLLHTTQTKNLYICGRHFSKTQYRNPDSNNLNRNAVPDIIDIVLPLPPFEVEIILPAEEENSETLSENIEVDITDAESELNTSSKSKRKKFKPGILHSKNSKIRKITNQEETSIKNVASSSTILESKNAACSSSISQLEAEIADLEKNIINNKEPFKMIWNGYIKLPNEMWSTVKIQDVKKCVSFGKYILTRKGIPAAHRQVLVKEDLSVTYIFNDIIVKKLKYPQVIRTITELEGILNQIDVFRACKGGTPIDVIKPSLFELQNKKEYVDIISNVWRHQKCLWVVEINSLHCKYCKKIL